MHFSSSGDAIISHDTANLALFVNEPPKHDFFNRVSGKIQAAQANVQARFFLGFRVLVFWHTNFFADRSALGWSMLRFGTLKKEKVKKKKTNKTN